MATVAPVSGIKPPHPPDFGTVKHLSESWRLFKQKWMNYAVITKLATHDRAYQVALLLHTLGDEGLKIYNGFQFDTTEDVRSTEEILAKFDSFAVGEVNETYERFLFNKREQKEGESVESFIAAIRGLMKTCNYHADSQDSILRDRIVLGIREQETQKLLLREPKLTLDLCINICKAAENANTQGKILRPELGEATLIKKVRGSQQRSATKQATRKAAAKPKPPSDNRKTRYTAPQKRECNFCGLTHVMKKEDCPAWGKTCTNCKGKNHFKAKCKKTKVHTVHDNYDAYTDSDDEYDAYLANVNSERRKILTAKLGVNGCHIRFQMDTGAEVNTICQRFVHKEQVQSTKVKLVMWNDTKVKPLGEAKIPILNVWTGEHHTAVFIVVPNNLNCLLGLKTMTDMHLITVNKDRFIAGITSLTNQPLGDLGLAGLQVDPTKKPRTLPCRKIPIALRGDVHAELDNLVERGVLIPVTEPTQWVSQMAVVRKSNGKLRICIDPQPLNEALMREHYKLPTVDDVLPMLHDAKVFSKLDVKEAFWHVRLDEESSKLTTMITPFGRFRWARLPFGLKVSSEIFQRKLMDALSGLDGVFTIADDIIIAGCGKTKSEAIKDNDVKLAKLYQRCKEQHIILNDAKKEIGKSEIQFHGHRFTDHGVKVDKSKVEAVLKMPHPTDIQGVKRLCGMVQYMAKFLPNLAADLEPIRALTRKDTEWNWSTACDIALETVKQKLSTTPVLAYFDSNKDIVLQVDSSKDGIGAVLLQGGRPVEYASRTLTTTERNWAQIEKELLAVVFGLERFDQYTYGTKVTVQNDHKPLASIIRKPLSQAPKRLQALMMRVHRYNMDFHFLKGSELVIADTLSRAYIDSPDLRPRILAITFFPDISDARLQEVKEATSRDMALKTLQSLILDGWPNAKCQVPNDARPYYDIRDVLSCEDGVILKGEAVIIPKCLRRDIMKRLHSAHMGYNSMIRRARSLVFWPNMAKDIKQLVDTCEPCQELRPRNLRETLKPQDDGNGPWDKIASDIFEAKGRQYLATVDYYSNFIEVDQLQTTTSTKLISLYKKQFARFGIPRVLTTDSGSQFTSGEFQNFLKDWGIIHVRSSPGHHSANGKAEAAVKVAKHLIMKVGKDGTDPNIALLEQRNTPRADTGKSPAEMIFGYKPRTMLPRFQKDHRDPDVVRQKAKRRSAVKQYHDRRAHDLPQLHPGQSVYFELKEHDRWILGKIVEVAGDRTYMVEGQNNGLYRRNRVQIRPTKVELPRHTPPPWMPHTSSGTKPLPRQTPQLDTHGKVNPTSNTDQGPKAHAKPPILEQTIRKSDRIRKEPSYLKDYVRN